MFGFGTSEMFIIIVVMAAIGIAVGRALASGLSDEKRKIVGGVAFLVGVAFMIFGVSSINSASAQLMGALGRPDLSGFAALGFGVIAAIIGLVVLISKGSSSKSEQVSSKRKCPFCAEIIQAEAKVCRFCGKEVEVLSLNRS